MTLTSPAGTTDTGPPTSAVPTTMRASVLTAVGRLEVQERPVPTPAADEVLVRAAAVGVCGSDVHWYREGHIGDLWLDGPLILGHECGGRIAAVGSAVDPDRIGQRVSIEPQRPCRRCAQCSAGRYNLCLRIEFYGTPPIDGAFCDYVTIQHEFAFPVPEVMSDDAAALLEPLSVAIASLRKASVGAGSRLLIAGAGPIGVITAQAARAFGAAEVIVTDPVAARRDRALRYGASSVLDPVADDVATLGLDVDAFIDASGAPPAVTSGINAVRPAGAVVLVGMGSAVMPLPVSTLQNREITVTGIFRYVDTWPTAIHLVTSGLVDLDSLVTGRYDLDHVQEALDADQAPDSLKSIVEP